MNEIQTAKKQNTKKIVAVVAVLLVLVAIAATAANFNTIKSWLNPVDTVSYTLTINVGDKTVEQLNIEAETTKSLLDTMKEKLELEETDGFITSICGHSQNYETNEYWVYTVNGESIMVGAADYYPNNNDVIIFSLQEIVF